MRFAAAKTTGSINKLAFLAGNEDNFRREVESTVNLSQVARNHVQYSAGMKRAMTKRVRIPLRSRGESVAVSTFRDH